jgi:hypothetical protein
VSDASTPLAHRRAALKLDAAEPGRTFTYTDVLAQLTVDGYERKLRSVVDRLVRETRVPGGAVVRVAQGSFVRRTGPGPGVLQLEDRVVAAARQLSESGMNKFSIADLLATGAATGPLSQRAAYYGLQRLLAEDPPRLTRPRLGRYKYGSE